jgi:acyl-CoA synthetase (AMP-forming)/AMP-acid ligase II
VSRRDRIVLAARAVRALARTGVLRPLAPDRAVRMVRVGRRLGVGSSAICAISAIRLPERTALIDDDGSLTYAELDRRGAALAGALRADHGVGTGGPGAPLAIMCRNHRTFVEALLAGSRLGADVLLLNTDFPGPQLAQVLERQPPGVVIHDAEFEAVFAGAGYEGARLDDAAVAALIGRGAAPPADGPRRSGAITLLSSGTTGVPKGAAREPSPGAFAGPLVTLLEQLGLRSGDPMLVGPPLFHGFGLAYLGIALFLGCPLVLRRRFDPVVALADVERHRVACVVGVPVMLQRLLAAHSGARDTRSLRAAISAGAPLSPQLSEAFMDAFGDVMFNLYGSTETGFGSIAGPADLRAAPGTVGRAPLGTVIKVLGADRRELPAGAVGHVFLGSEMVMEGYAGGGSKEVVDGLMNTGDLGHLDSAGRLFVDGREDDMIVSGGENVFPLEVEETLAGHAGVSDVVVVGVEDAEFGQRLRAYAVRATDADVDEEGLRAYVKQRLARYKVPREIVFVTEIPRTPTGKVVRSRLG